MIRVPTARRRRKPDAKLNLTPIMDAVFIFIFFLLTSVNFVKIMEIGSDVPIISETEPPPETEPPMMLQLIIRPEAIELTRGLEREVVGTYASSSAGQYDLVALHERLVQLKREKASEESIILTPEWDIDYEDLVKIMDSVRLLERTDEAIFKKSKDGLDVKVESLFPKILFSNLMG